MAFGETENMQIELATILNKAWAGLIVFIPWAKKALDARFEETEKKVSSMTKQLTDLATSVDIINTKLEFQKEATKEQGVKLDELRSLIIDLLKDHK